MYSYRYNTQLFSSTQIVTQVYMTWYLIIYAVHLIYIYENKGKLNLKNDIIDYRLRKKHHYFILIYSDNTQALNTWNFFEYFSSDNRVWVLSSNKSI